MAIDDDQAVAALRARAALDWEEHDRILSEATDGIAVMYKYGHLVSWAFTTLFRRRFPEPRRPDVIRYVAEVRTRTPVLHPREMNPRLAEEIVIGALSGVPITTLTEQGFRPDEISKAIDFLTTAILTDGNLYQADVFDDLIRELRPQLEALEISEQLPDQLDAAISQYLASEPPATDVRDAGSAG